MTFQEYVEKNRKKKVNADIAERWQTRVVAQGLNNMGANGALIYLDNYGKSIGAAKCVGLAVCAEQNGCSEMAQVFWIKAYNLEMHENLPLIGGPTMTCQGGTTPIVAPVERVEAPQNFPDGLNPGQLVTMQPEDGKMDVEFYIKSDQYWCQAKRDGNKVVAFVTPNEVVYQSRSMKLRASPNRFLDEALMNEARKIGKFILEGELYYLDCAGKEHRTAAQALSVNAELGNGHIMPIMKYAVFACLYCEPCSDMRSASQFVRVEQGLKIAEDMNYAGVEALYTARSEAEKRALVAQQQAEGREGMVFFDRYMPYHGGKDHSDRIIRKKFLTEFVGTILEVAPSKAEGHFIGGFEVSYKGKSVGSVGTGYTRDEQQDILRRHQTAPGNVRVNIVCQGFTEYGQMMHGRFDGFAE